MEKLEPSNTADGKAKWYNLCEKQFDDLSKCQKELTYDTSMILLGIYPKDLKIGIQINAGTQTFIAALL